MELFDLYDRERNKTGRTMERGTPIPEGCYRMVVHVCVFDSNGKMLIQRRQPFKRSWSGMWDLTVGGSSVSGDTSLSAAIREVSEEIGLTLAPYELRRVMTLQTDEVFDDFYIANVDLDIKNLILQKTEVAEVKWADKSEILSMIDEKRFVPHHGAIIELLFYRQNHDGDFTADDTTVPHK